MDFLLLGPMQVDHDGVALNLGRRRERCLLGLLMLEPGRVLPADRLLDLLWDDEPPDTGLGQLRSNVSRLRTRLKAYGDGRDGVRIRTHGSGYSIDLDPDRVDVHRFRQLLGQATPRPDPAARAELLRAALALWRGPVMADVMSDPLRRRVAAGLEELRLTALERLAEANLLAGCARDVVTELTELTARHPLRERFTALLMIAHVQTGNQAEASRIYHGLRDRLADQLGLDPNADLSDLHDRILRRDPTLLVPAAGTDAALTVGANVPGQPPADLPQLTDRTRPAPAAGDDHAAGTSAVVAADSGRAMAWFTAEHPVLPAAIRQVAGTGFDTQTWQLAWTLASFLSLKGHWYDWVATQEAVFDAAQRLADRSGRAVIHQLLGRADTWLGGHDDAYTHLRHALDLFGEVADRTGQARTHLDLSILLPRQGRHREALDHAQQGLDLYRAAGHRAGQAGAVSAVGWCYAQLGDYRQAVGCYQRAIDLYRDLGDRYFEARALTRLGDTHDAAGDPRAARDVWHQALAILTDLDHPNAEQVRTKLDSLDRPEVEPVAPGAQLTR
jgi:DNA-binding SARP family transcriptional activator